MPKNGRKLVGKGKKASDSLVTKSFLKSYLKQELTKAITASERRQDAKMEINMQLIQRSFQGVQEQFSRMGKTLAKIQNTMDTFIGRTI